VCLNPAARTAQGEGAAMPTSTKAHGKICYVEIPATDVAASADFYRAVLVSRA